MWCNNCCLCFPVRGGAMWLAGLVIVINGIGGILLFLWGPYFFSSTMALIFGGFSALQAATAGIAFLGLCNVRTLSLSLSHTLSRHILSLIQECSYLLSFIYFIVLCFLPKVSMYVPVTHIFI